MDSLIDLLKSLGIYGIFISIALENLGVPFPTEAAYIYSVILIGHGRSYWLLLAVLTSAHVVGSSISYSIGYWGDVFLTKRLSSKQKFIKTNEWLHRWFSKYGAATVFFTRFVGYVRPWSSFIAGFAQVNFLVFFIWTLLGSFIFTVMVLFFTFKVLSVWHEAHGFLRALMVAGMLISIGMLYVVKIIWDRQYHRISAEPDETPKTEELPKPDEPPKIV